MHIRLYGDMILERPPKYIENFEKIERTLVKHIPLSDLTPSSTNIGRIQVCLQHGYFHFFPLFLMYLEGLYSLEHNILIPMFKYMLDTDISGKQSVGAKQEFSLLSIIF